MLNTETTKKVGKALGIFAIVMLALAAHQKFVAPHLSPKAKGPAAKV